MRFRFIVIGLAGLLAAGAALGQEAAKQITFSERHDADPIVSPDGNETCGTDPLENRRNLRRFRALKCTGRTFLRDPAPFDEFREVWLP